MLNRFNVHRKAHSLLEEGSAAWLSVEWLPGYAPDLNPVEAMWGCTNYGDLANSTTDDLYDLRREIGDSLVCQYRDPKLKRSDFQTAQLDL